MKKTRSSRPGDKRSAAEKLKAQSLSPREDILKTAGGLFARKGYFGVSMRDIADGVGMTKAALYYHFKSKEELFLEVLERTFARLFRRLTAAAGGGRNPAETLFRVIDGYLTFTLENPQTSLFYSAGAGEGSAEIQKFILGIHKKISSLFENLFEKASLEEREQREAVSQLTKALLGILANPLIFGREEGKKTARFLSRLFVSGLAGSQSEKRKTND